VIVCGFFSVEGNLCRFLLFFGGRKSVQVFFGGSTSVQVFFGRRKSVRVFFGGRKSVQVFIACLYLYCRLMSNYHEGKVEILLNGITPPHLCLFQSQELDLQRHISWVFSSY
jgi:hypothetical protein